MTAPQASTRREFLGAIGTGGLLVVGLAGVTGVVASGCSGGGAGQPTPTSADPGDSEVTVVPVLPELPDDDPLRHWSSLTSRAVLDFGRLVAEADLAATAHAIGRLAGTPDSDDPTVAMRALDEACAADIAEGELVAVDTWTVPRTLAGLAAGLAAAE